MANINQAHEDSQQNPSNTGAGAPPTEQISSPASSSSSVPSGQAASPTLNLSSLHPTGGNTHPAPNSSGVGATQGGQAPPPHVVSLEEQRHTAEAITEHLKSAMRETAQQSLQWKILLASPANEQNTDDLEDNILRLDTEYNKLAKRLRSIEMSLLALAPDSVPVAPAPMNHAPRQYAVWEHRRNPVIKLDPTWKSFGEKGIKGARNFMEYFLFKVKPTIEPEDFKREGHVYLSLLIERIDHQRQINTALDAARDKGEDVNWQKIEDTFYDVCLTEEEKANAMKELTTLGRRKGETWRGFAERVRIVARQNRALDNDLMLQPLTRSLPDDIQRHLQVWLKCEQRSIFKTVAEFCNCLQEVPGPTNLQEESSPTTLATSSTATYFCQICNINATHSTDGHKECSSCNRVGHSTEDCRSRSRQDSYQSNFRDDRRRRAYSPTRRNDRYRQQDNRREPYRDNRRRNDYRPTNGNSR
ncbi:hypothetical protein B0O80DRAFT_427554 [Mortierella sp. GBAus27b]|nr:hypothetical protein B0O80DRAFT_427554 [Mortierella sp. GBAus27b]